MSNVSNLPVHMQADADAAVQALENINNGDADILTGEPEMDAILLDGQPIDGGAPAQGTQTPVQGTQAPAQGAPAPVQGAPAPNAADSLNAELFSNVIALTKKVEELQANQVAAKVEPKPTIPEPKVYLKDEDRETYSPEDIDYNMRIAKQVVEEQSYELRKRVLALTEELAEIRAQNEATAGQVTQASFESALLTQVPDFHVVNNSPAWFQWLDEFDPAIQGPRRTAVTLAYQSGNANAVANFVRMFKGEPVYNEAEPPPAYNPAIAHTAPATATPAHTGRPQPLTFTVTRANELMNQAAAMVRSGDPTMKERGVRISASIDRAMKEGRVVEG